LENAREHGVAAFEGVRVLDLSTEGERAIGVRVQEGKTAKARDVRARVVVDASGQSGFLSSKLGLRTWDPLLDKGAIWTYWKGAYRDSGKDEGATMVLQTGDKKGWFWYIPLHEDRVSVGVVKPFATLFADKRPHEEVYLAEVERCIAVRQRVKDAT